MAPYVGHRFVLPQQNVNDWVHPFKGEATYSNWALLSPVQLLDEVGHEDLPDHSQYNVRRQLWQMFSGEWGYAPMELAKYNHGGQDAPYLRHAHWEKHGVPASEVFPRFISAKPAVVQGDTIDINDPAWDDDGTPVTATLTVDGDGSADITDPASLADIVNQANAGSITSAFVTLNADEDGIAVVSNDTGSEIEITVSSDAPLNISGSATGTDAEGRTWGYTLHEALTRDFTFSRHSNHFFLGVEGSRKTLGSGGFQVMRFWDDEDLPSYATRHAPFEYKGVGDDRVEDPGEPLAIKYERAESSNEHPHQRTQEWFGVQSAKAL